MEKDEFPEFGSILHNLKTEQFVTEQVFNTNMVMKQNTKIVIRPVEPNTKKVIRPI